MSRTCAPVRGVALVLLIAASPGCGAPAGAGASGGARTDGTTGGASDRGDVEEEGPREHVWTRLAPEGRGFSVELLGEPRETVRGEGGEGARPLSYSVEASADGYAFRVQYVESAEDAPGPSAEPDALREVFLSPNAHPGMRVAQDRAIEVDGHPGVEVQLRWEASGRDFALWARALVVGRRVYRLTVRPQRARPPVDFDAVAGRFLGSFTLAP